MNKPTLSNIFAVFRFVLSGSGKEYDITKLQKLSLARKVIKAFNDNKRNRLGHWRKHLILIEEIFNIPKHIKGDIVECGAYNGGTTIPLSLACSMTSRTLFVCDSFEGLPEPNPNTKHDIHDDSGRHYIWEKGEFKSSLLENQINVATYGSYPACTFVRGYFKDTLPNLETDSIAMVFEDADIPESVQDCLRYLWPKLQYGCKFYCDEPWSINVVSIFYDGNWWNENLNRDPPGFFGSGRGIKFGLAYSSLGYAKKFDFEKAKKGEKIIHLGTKGYICTHEIDCLQCKRWKNTNYFCSDFCIHRAESKSSINVRRGKPRQCHFERRKLRPLDMIKEECPYYYALSNSNLASCFIAHKSFPKDFECLSDCKTGQRAIKRTRKRRPCRHGRDPCDSCRKIDRPVCLLYCMHYKHPTDKFVPLRVKNCMYKGA